MSGLERCIRRRYENQAGRIRNIEESDWWFSPEEIEEAYKEYERLTKLLDHINQTMRSSR